MTWCLPYPFLYTEERRINQRGEPPNVMKQGRICLFFTLTLGKDLAKVLVVIECN